jgi:acetyltransferase
MDGDTLLNRAPTLATGYPAGLTRIVQLADGTSVMLRPICAEDAAAEREFVHRLSPRARYLRFLGPVNDITPELLSRWTEIDYSREMALVAVIATPEGERQIGVARYVMLDDGATCEVAVVVSDDWQGKGVAHYLLRSLIDAGRARGLRTMVGITLPENERVKNLARQAGFELAADPDDRQLVQMTLSLA